MLFTIIIIMKTIISIIDIIQSDIVSVIIVNSIMSVLLLSMFVSVIIVSVSIIK